jgi:hypothetical protein
MAIAVKPHITDQAKRIAGPVPAHPKSPDMAALSAYQAGTDEEPTAPATGDTPDLVYTILGFLRDYS